MCAQEGECGLRFKATVPGVYKWSFFAVTKLGEDCPEEPTGFNRFGTCLNSVQMSFKVVYKYPLEKNIRYTRDYPEFVVPGTGVALKSRPPCDPMPSPGVPYMRA